MKLNILTPEGSIYSGDAYGVQLPGVTGSFEVLDKHAPLIAALTKGRLKVLEGSLNGTATYYDIQGGFVEVLNNNVTVLVEGANKV
ncbi:ATP synthase epsilon chain [Mycovorax composti]|jgi:ATP synthase, F1 epsilon subunit (delta in mitochondria)|uniref:ATP synthase epsilon chain n=2 Tax=Chitinophagaceae TaxID=563835 RepID=A0ABZ2EJT4_9BACT